MADVCFSKGSSYISAINWYMSTKFGLLIDFLTFWRQRYQQMRNRFGHHIALSRWRPRPLNTISGFAFVDIAAFRRSRSLWANQILSTYINWWLRYNYFRFWKTNVRHIGNLFSVSILTICPKSAHYCASGYRISSKSKQYYFRFRICWYRCL